MGVPGDEYTNVGTILSPFYVFEIFKNKEEQIGNQHTKMNSEQI